MGKHKVDKEKKSKENKHHSKKTKKDKKSKDAKHSKHSKHSKKSSHQKNKDKSSGILAASSSSREPITVDDYFLKNEHFRVWCVLIKKISFETLTSDESHHMFKSEFLTAYNHDRLPEMFYKDEIPIEMREAALKTKHKWNFKVSNEDKEAISLVADDVDFKTRHVTQGAWNHMHKPNTSSNPNSSDIIHTNNISSSSNYTNNASYHTTENPENNRRSTHDDNRLRQDDVRDEYKHKQSQTKKEYNNYSSNVLDEFSTYSGVAKNNKLEQSEKQKAMVQSSHAAAKEREEDRDGLNIDEKFIMGGGDDFESTKARLNKNKDFRQQIKTERAKELLEKEELKNAHFMSQLGVDLTKGPIRIQPREH